MNERIKKLRDELRPRDLHFRSECEEFKCGAHKSWEEGFDAANDLLMQDAKELVAALKNAESYMFQACQPDRGELFGEFDDKNRAALAKWRERYE